MHVELRRTSCTLPPFALPGGTPLRAHNLSRESGFPVALSRGWLRVDSFTLGSSHGRVLSRLFPDVHSCAVFAHVVKRCIFLPAWTHAGQSKTLLRL